MKQLLETLRYFFLSLEAVAVLVGILVEARYSSQALAIFASIKVPDEQLKYLVMLPAGLCTWAFVSGRRLLFPEKDKSNVLLEWPDYWKLKAAFHAALTWSVIFAATSIVVWFADWKQTTSLELIALVVSILGAAICALSIYNAQNIVEEAVGRFRDGR